MLDLAVEFFPWDWILWTVQDRVNEVRLQLNHSYVVGSLIISSSTVSLKLPFDEIRVPKYVSTRVQVLTRELTVNFPARFWKIVILVVFEFTSSINVC